MEIKNELEQPLILNAQKVEIKKSKSINEPADQIQKK
jgi:hypothetical protein